MRGSRWGALLLSGAVLLGLSACNKSPEGAGKGRGGKGAVAFPVEVAPVQQRDVEYSVRAVGSIEAFETVLLTSRVSGVVDKVSFTEGQNAKPGETLIEIDSRRFQLAVDAAQAALEKARATKAEAEASLGRREAITKENPGLIPGEELESFRTRARTAVAEERAAEVALAQARLNLKDAFVRAPVAGVLQTRTVQTGQFVQPGTVLATLLRRDPLLVRFRVPEAEAARLSENQLARFYLRGSSEPWEAKIRHVSGAAEEATRMVLVTAEVQGDKRDSLRPGAFAEITVPIGSSGNAPVVPQTAIRPSERGFLAFVIEGELARERVLQLGLRTETGEVEVLSGVKHGESLVVRGAEALKEGSKVRIVPASQSGHKPVKVGGAEPAQAPSN